MGMGRKPRVSRCGPEARAPAGLHDAGRGPPAPTGVHGSGVIGSRCGMFVGGTPLVDCSVSEDCT